MQRSWLETCFNLIEEYVPKGLEPYAKDKNARTAFNRISIHAATVAELLKLSNPQPTEQERIADLFANIGFGHYSTANSNAALEMYEKSLAINIRLFGEQHPNVSALFGSIAIIYSDKGYYEEALSWHNRDLETSSNITDSDKLNRAITYGNIASIFKEQGNYPEALELYEKSLGIRRKYLATNTQTSLPHTITSLYFIKIKVILKSL